MLFTDLIALFPYAVATGVLMSVSCAVIGVFVIVKRVVFISIALSESAACGIAAAMLLDLPPILGASIFSVAVVLLLSGNYENSRVPRDTILGMVFLLASSLSILLVAESGFGLHEVKSMLYGDLILAGEADLYILVAVAVPVVVFILAFQRPILYTFLDREASQVMGIRCRFWEMSFFFMLGMLVSASSKSGGALLVFCYLVVVPATALMLSRNLSAILIMSPLSGITVTLFGLGLSYNHDLPGNQTIIVVACLLFMSSSVFVFLGKIVFRLCVGDRKPR